MKNFKILLNMFSILLFSIFIGAIFLFLSYSLPTEKIYKNLQNSLVIQNFTEDHPRWGKTVQTQTDNFTVGIMLMKAAYPVEKNIIYSSMLNPSWNFIENSPTKTLSNVLQKNSNQLDENSFIYPRYWHGYLVPLKTLLFFTDLGYIYELNFVLQFVLFLSVLFLIQKNFGGKYFFAFAVTLLIMNPLTIGLDFQLSSVFYITMFSIIFILMKNEFLLRKNFFIYFFMTVGILTAYFDLLTYPLVTFGLPFCIFGLMNKEKIFSQEPKEILKFFGANIFSWFFGYFGMWSGKFISASLLTEVNVIQDAIFSALYRTSLNLNAVEGAKSFSIFQVFDNIVGIIFRSGGIILVVCIIVAIYLLIRKKIKFSFDKKIFIFFGLIMILPFIWFTVFSNHSFVHPFLSYRELSITIFAAFAFWFEITKSKI
ncbi:MAG: hypothetical protein IK062_07525 [Selenomonadaceae bacterium]|nr:hypothetical protein [Selenomonadaceae bacterium]